MASGVPILGTKTKPCKVNIINKTTFKITLTEGLNRQIRRMCAHFGYDVKSLTRLRIMNIQLGGLRTGQWRKLSQTELEQLSAAVSQSSSETRKTTRRRKKPSPNYQGKNAYLAAGQNKREQVVTEKTAPNSTRKKRPAKNAPKGAGKTAARPTAKGKPSARAKPPSKPLRAATRPSKRQK
jgi:hypothetical protein